MKSFRDWLGSWVLLVGVWLVAHVHGIIETFRPLFKFRMAAWTVTTVLLVGANLYFQQHDIIKEILFKIVLVPLFAVMGYWLDREGSPYARPHTFLDGSAAGGDGTPLPDWRGVALFAIATIRRVFLVGLCIVAGTMAL